MPDIVSEKTYVRFVASEFVDLIKASIPTLSDAEFIILNSSEVCHGEGLDYITFTLKLKQPDDLELEPWSKLRIDNRDGDND